MQTRSKEAAASKAAELLSDIIKPGMLVGVGTGSTVKLVIDHLVEDRRVRSTLSSVKLYASSLDTLLYLEERGLHASQLLPSTPLDVYFDGADEVAATASMCQVLKGRGAAMTREKVLAFNSRLNILVIDESKLSRQLGEKGKPVPVEVLPPALKPVIRLLESARVRVQVRECNCRDGPAVTDNYGVVVDTWPWGRLEPLRYEGLLDATPGVIGHGLFIGYFDRLVVGYGGGEAEVRSCRRTRGAALGAGREGSEGAKRSPS